MRSECIIRLIILLTIITTGCTYSSQEYSVATEELSETTQSFVSGPDTNFHKISDAFVIELTVTPPGNNTENWTVNWEIESLEPIKDVPVIFNILPEDICDVVVTGVEGNAVNEGWDYDSINARMDFPQDGITTITYILSDCEQTVEGRFATVKVELMYGAEQFVFDEADLFWSQGQGSVVYSETPFPTVTLEDPSAKLTPWSFYEITPGDFLLTPGVTQLPPTPMCTWTAVPPSLTETPTITGVPADPTPSTPYP